jgi:hypothetical protein
MRAWNNKQMTGILESFTISMLVFDEMILIVKYQKSLAVTVDRYREYLFTELLKHQKIRTKIGQSF